MKVIKKLFEVFKVLEACLVIVLLTIRFIPLLFGYEVFGVLSGSMEPEIQTGALAYVDTNVKSEDMEVGDIIAFYIKDENTYVTHRVVDINEDERTFITKGDANEVIDFSPIPFSQVIGETTYSIPYFGYLFDWFESTAGRWCLGALIVAQLLLEYLFYLLIKEEEEEDGTCREKEND